MLSEKIEELLRTVRRTILSSSSIFSLNKKKGGWRERDATKALVVMPL